MGKQYNEIITKLKAEKSVANNAEVALRLD